MIKWLYRKYAIFGFRKKCALDLATQQVLKEWITACIIERKQEGRRKELLEAQAGIKEVELFAKWLKALK